MKEKKKSFIALTPVLSSLTAVCNRRPNFGGILLRSGTYSGAPCSGWASLGGRLSGARCCTISPPWPGWWTASEACTACSEGVSDEILRLKRIRDPKRSSRGGSWRGRGSGQTSSGSVTGFGLKWKTWATTLQKRFSAATAAGRNKLECLSFLEISSLIPASLPIEHGGGCSLPPLTNTLAYFGQTVGDEERPIYDVDTWLSKRCRRPCTSGSASVLRRNRQTGN